MTSASKGDFHQPRAFLGRYSHGTCLAGVPLPSQEALGRPAAGPRDEGTEECSRLGGKHPHTLSKLGWERCSISAPALAFCSAWDHACNSAFRALQYCLVCVGHHMGQQNSRLVAILWYGG